METTGDENPTLTDAEVVGWQAARTAAHKIKENGLNMNGLTKLLVPLGICVDEWKTSQIAHL